MLEAHHLIVIWQSLGVMAMCALAFGILQQRMADTAARAVLLGIVFGWGAVLSMLAPMTFGGGIMDARSIFVGFAALFGGLPAAGVSAAMAIVYRGWFGGPGAWMGILGILAVVAIGLLWRQRRPCARVGTMPIRNFALFGLCSSFHLILLLALPSPDRFGYFLNAWLFMTPVFVAGSVVMGLMMQREYNLIQREQALEKDALTDPLTGLANRRAFDGLFEQEVAAGREETRGPSLLVVDVDHFKQVNDTFGHEKGDVALRRITEVLCSVVREGDTVSRYGGEEFCVLLPRTSKEVALIIAERVRTALAGTSISLGQQTIQLTVSVGVASAQDSGDDASALFAAADRALYRAKRQGRDRVLVADRRDWGPEVRALPVHRPVEPAPDLETMSS